MQGTRVDLWEEVLQPFLRIKEEFEGAIVFLDEGAAEIVRWSVGGPSFLFSLGARNVLQLPPAQSVDDGRPPHRFTSSRVLFFLTSFLPEYKLRIKSVLSAHSFSECLVYMSLTEKAHSHYPELGGGIFNAYTAMMKDWMKMKAPVAPVFFENTFFLPSCAACFPFGTEDKNSLPLAHTLARFLKIFNIKQDAYTLGPYSRIVVEKIQDIQSRAQVSVEDEDEDSPSTYNPQQATLILIDRSLDLVAPLKHSDNLVDMIKNLLPSPYPNSNDVNINFYSLTPGMPADISPAIFQDMQIFGSLAQPPSDSASRSLLQTMATSTQKEALNGTVKKLIDTISKEKLPIDLSKAVGTVTPTRLVSLLKIFQKSPIVFYRHSGLVQCVSAIVHAIQLSKTTSWESLVAAEKILLHTALDSAHQSLVAQITKLLTGGKYALQDILGLAILCYSFLGSARGFPVQDERKFGDAIAECLMNHPQTSYDWVPTVKSMLEEHHALLAKEKQVKAKGKESEKGKDKENDIEKEPEKETELLEKGKEKEDVNEKETSNGEAEEATEMQEKSEEDIKFFRMQLKHSLDDVGEEIVDKLNSVRLKRESLKDYGQLWKKGATGPVYSSLVSQVVADVFAPEIDGTSPPLNDLERLSSSSISDFLGGFSFGGVLGKQKARPTDHKLIIIMVLGGITCTELQEVNSILQKENIKKKYQVLIGSTRLSTTDHTFRSVLNS